MKVNEGRIITSAVLDAYRKQVQKPRSTEAPKAGATVPPGSERVGEDTLMLSDRVREMEKYRKVLGAMNEARAKLVERIAQKVREGTYHVDSRAIAEKILARLRDGE